MSSGDLQDDSPSCRYNDAQIFYLLHVLGREGPMQTKVLAGMLNTDDTSIGCMVVPLKKWGLIDVHRNIVGITEQGKLFLGDIRLEPVTVPKTEYVIGRIQRSVLVRGAASSVDNGMVQRDSAIMAGANGATVLTMENGTLLMPRNWNMDSRDPGFAEMIRDYTGISEGDVLIMSGSDSPNTSMMAAISVGLNLLWSYR